MSCCLFRGARSAPCVSCEVSLAAANPFAIHATVLLSFSAEPLHGSDTDSTDDDDEVSLRCDFGPLGGVARFPSFHLRIPNTGNDVRGRTTEATTERDAMPPPKRRLLHTVRIAPDTPPRPGAPAPAVFVARGIRLSPPAGTASSEASKGASGFIQIEADFFTHCAAPRTNEGGDRFRLALPISVWAPRVTGLYVRFCEPPPPPSAPACRWDVAARIVAEVGNAFEVPLAVSRPASLVVARSGACVSAPLEVSAGSVLEVTFWPDPTGGPQHRRSSALAARTASSPTIFFGKLKPTWRVLALCFCAFWFWSSLTRMLGVSTL